MTTFSTLIFHTSEVFPNTSNNKKLSLLVIESWLHYCTLIIYSNLVLLASKSYFLRIKKLTPAQSGKQSSPNFYSLSLWYKYNQGFDFSCYYLRNPKRFES